MDRLREDRGDIVLGWLTKVTVVFGLIGLVGFDVVSLGVGRMQAEDRAGSSARAAVRAWADTQDVQHAYDAAVSELADSGADATIAPTTFSVDQSGAVTLTVEQTSATFLVEKVGPVRDWATMSATVTAHPAS